MDVRIVFLRNSAVQSNFGQRYTVNTAVGRVKHRERLAEGLYCISADERWIL